MRVRYHTILLIAVAAAKSTRFANFKMARMGSAWLADMLLNKPAIGSGGGSSHAPASATELTGEGAVPSKVVGAKRLVQYGIKRSATTLQWVIVEAYVCALGMDGHVEKLHDQAKALSMVKDGVPLFVTHVTRSLHTFGVSEDFQPNTWRETARTLERQWKLPAGAIAYVQETALVSLRDWRIVEDYAGVFGLSQESTATLEVVEYIRLWDMLRRCCGPQMSEDYRARLYGNATNVSATDFAPMHRGPGSVAYDACEMYDIGAAEQLLLKTALFRRCPTMRSSLQSYMSWAKLNGTFCERYEAAAVATRAKFNQNPFKMG